MIHRCFEPLINSLVLLGRWMSFPEWEKMLSSTCNMFLNREWEMSICMDFMHIILERSGFNTVSKSHLKQTISWLWIRDNGSTVNCSKRLSPLDSYGTMIPYYAVTFIAHAKVRTNHRNTNKTYHWNHQGHSCSRSWFCIRRLGLAAMVNSQTRVLRQKSFALEELYQ